MIDGGANDRVDVFAFQKFLVIREGLAAAADEILHFFGAMFRNVTNSDLRDVVRSRMLLHLANVRIETLSAHADESDGDAVIRADHPASRRRLVLAVNRRLEHVCDGHCSGRGGSLLNEIPARFASGFRLISHKTLS